MQLGKKDFKWDFKKAAGVALLFMAAGSAWAAKASGTGVPYFSVGDPKKMDVTARPISCSPSSCAPSVVLMGGGYDVGEAFRWMITQAGITKTSGGRVVIIRATGTDAYNPYIFSKLGQVDPTTPKNYEMVGGADLGVTSVETLIISSRAAAEDTVMLEVISKANAIFIAGGDQADYYNYWQNTALDTALQKAVTAGIPIGGTSAGSAMLGQYAFAALNGTVTTTQALTDPFNRAMTIDPLNTSSRKFVQSGSFINVPTLTKLITDTHVNTRDRLGRLFSFVSRIGSKCTSGVENFSDVVGVGIDEETALLISGPLGNAKAELVANPYNIDNSTSQYTPQNSAYFVKITTEPTQCVAGKPLIDSGINVYRLSAQPSGSVPQYSFTHKSEI